MANSMSMIKSAITPSKRTGVKKNLLKRDGITSDGINEDDDSSSLSDRQEKRKSKSKKRFSALKFLCRKNTKNGVDEDGYESDASTGSTRSTSSSFLRYQNRAIWRAKLMKKSVLQRFGDGSEAPVQDEAKWPMFDRIYRRQNQLKKGQVGDNEDLEYDNDSVSSAESGEDDHLGPPAPMINISLEEDTLDDLGLNQSCDTGGTEEVAAEKETHEQETQQQSRVPDGMAEIATEKESQKQSVALEKKSEESGEGGDGSASSEAAPEKGSDESQEDVNCLASHEVASEKEAVAVDLTPKETVKQSIEPQSGSSSGVISPTSIMRLAAEEEPIDSEESNKAGTVQASGIPTSETPKKETALSPAASPLTNSPQQLIPQVSQELPTQRLTQLPPLKNTFKENKSKRANVKSSRQSREGKKISFDNGNEDAIPLSIPQTICYSLRSAIGDGSARQRNSHSLMERRPLKPNGCHLETSYWSHRGRRNYMEDRFVIEHIGSLNKNEKNAKPISLLAVFDGHGGSSASSFCSDWLSSYIRKKNEHYPENLGLAMKNAFTKMDSDFVKSGRFDGTTACACMVVGKKIICCNAGDSRAIIVKRDGSAVELSKDHKPDRDDETKRINDLGGRVIHWGRWRVEGVLAVSRSIGDAKLKPYVTAEPDMVEHEICDDDMFLVVASDGVWDTCSSDLVAKFVLVNTCKIVNKSLQVDDKLLRWIARQISKRARENGSSDNISCIVANLKRKKCN